MSETVREGTIEIPKNEENRTIESDNTTENFTNITTDGLTNTTQNTTSDETQITTKDKTQNTTKDIVKNTIKDETQNTTKGETQNTINDNTQNTTKDETQNTIKDSTQNTIKEKTQNTTRDKTQNTKKNKTQNATKPPQNNKNLAQPKRRKYGKNVVSTEEEEEAEEEDATIDPELQSSKYEFNQYPEDLGLKPFPECIVRRTEWGAAPPSSTPLPYARKPSKVVFNYSAGGEHCEEPEHCERVVRHMQLQYMEQGMADIPYNFLIGGDFRVYEGRGWDAQPEPAILPYPELTGRRFDIGFIGAHDLNTTDCAESWAMVGLAIDLMHYCVLEDRVKRLYTLVESELYLDPDGYKPGLKVKEKYVPFYVEENYPGNEVPPIPHVQCKCMFCTGENIYHNIFQD